MNNWKNYLKRSLASTKRMRGYIKLKEKISSNKGKKILTVVSLPIGLIKNVSSKEITDKSTYKYDLAIVVIIKNEGPYIKEWLEYYRLLGVKKFYIFDNESTDNTLKILKPYIENKIVDYTFLPGQARQMDAYNLALNKSKEDVKYLAIVDADEFIYLTNDKTNLYLELDKIFKKDKKIGGIGINWEIFGSSHFSKKQPGLVTQTFLYRSKSSFSVNRHIKTVCNPRKVAGVLNPHYVEYKKGYHAVNTLGEYMEGAMTNFSSSMPMRINHYFTKSKEEFLQKRSRGMADQNKIRNIKDFDVHDRNDIFDDGMVKFKKDLENRVKNYE